MNPRVTIVTPSFNQAAFLEQTIDSVLSQGYPNLEYLVIDGGSTDGSVDVIKRYAKHLTHWESRKDNGPADAINRGLNLATGEIMAYLNSDDLYEPGAVKTAVAGFEASPAAGVIYGDLKFIDAGGAPTTFPGKSVTVFRAAPFWAGALFHDAMFIPQQASFWRREIYAQAGPMQVENWTCWDHEFFIQAALAGTKFVRVPGILASFRMHAQSISTENRWQDKRERDHARIAQKIKTSGYVCTTAKGQYFKQLVRVARAVRYVIPSL